MQNNEIEKQPGCCEDELNTGLLTVSEAQARILDSVTAVNDTQTLSVRDALGRVLAEDIVSPIDVPSHTNSAMDGYAVRAEDLPAEGVREFPVPGTSWAGRPWLTCDRTRAGGADHDRWHDAGGCRHRCHAGAC